MKYINIITCFIKIITGIVKNLNSKKIVYNKTQSSIIALKPMCPMLQKAKTQKVRVWSKEKFIDWECANREDGSPSDSSSLKSIEFSLYLCQGKREMGGAVLWNSCWRQNSYND